MSYELLVKCGSGFVLAIFGLITGSFLNVCIYRIPRKLSVVSGNHGRSMCTTCKHDLRWYDLVPVFSYLFLKGRCRYCRDKISPRYPIVECLNSVLWMLAGFKYGLTLEAVCYGVFFSVLIVLSAIDWETQEIPYCLQISIAEIGLVSLLIPGFPGVKERIIGMLIISVPMAVGTMLNAFGGGDVQLMFVSGFFLGWKSMIVAIFVAIFAAAFHAIIVLRKKGAGTQIPFGPYLALGLIVAVFYGNQLVNWYIGFF